MTSIFFGLRSNKIFKGRSEDSFLSHPNESIEAKWQGRGWIFWIRHWLPCVSHVR